MHRDVFAGEDGFPGFRPHRVGVATVRIAVLRDQAAQRDTRVGVQKRQHALEDVAADALEVDVDAVRACDRQVLGIARRAVRYAGMKTEIVCDKVTLLRRPGDAHDAAAMEFRNLARRLADAARRGGHHDGFPGLWPALHGHARIRGQAQHSQDADGGGDRRYVWIESPGVHVAERADAFSGQAVLLPAIGIEQVIAGFMAAAAALDNLRDRAPVANVTHGFNAAPATAPLIGVHRQVDRAGQRLAVGWFRHGFL